MSQELMYTSAAKGLKPGSHGFCTVASTPGMAANLANLLESLSGYRHPAGGNPAANPVVWSYLRVTVGGRPSHILSRVADAGTDHTLRTNKFAHHLVLDATELPPAGPAWALQQPGMMETAWQGEPRILPAGRRPTAVDAPARACDAWQAVTGDAGWGGVLAATAAAGGGTIRPAWIVFRPGQDVLPLLAESLALLPVALRWSTSFCTYYTKLPAGIECLWKCALAGSIEEQLAWRSPQALLLDLTRPLGQAPASVWSEAARCGTAPAATRPAAPPNRMFGPALQPPPLGPSVGSPAGVLSPISTAPIDAPLPLRSDAAKPNSRRAKKRWWKELVWTSILLVISAGSLFGLWKMLREPVNDENTLATSSEDVGAAKPHDDGDRKPLSPVVPAPAADSRQSGAEVKPTEPSEPPTPSPAQSNAVPTGETSTTTKPAETAKPAIGSSSNPSPSKPQTPPLDTREPSATTGQSPAVGANLDRNQGQTPSPKTGRQDVNILPMEGLKTLSYPWPEDPAAVAPKLCAPPGLIAQSSGFRIVFDKENNKYTLQCLRLGAGGLEPTPVEIASLVQSQREMAFEWRTNSAIYAAVTNSILEMPDRQIPLRQPNCGALPISGKELCDGKEKRVSVFAEKPFDHREEVNKCFKKAATDSSSGVRLEMAFRMGDRCIVEPVEKNVCKWWIWFPDRDGLQLLATIRDVNTEPLLTLTLDMNDLTDSKIALKPQDITAASIFWESLKPTSGEEKETVDTQFNTWCTRLEKISKSHFVPATLKNLASQTEVRRDNPTDKQKIAFINHVSKICSEPIVERAGRFHKARTAYEALGKAELQWQLSLAWADYHLCIAESKGYSAGSPPPASPNAASR